MNETVHIDGFECRPAGPADCYAVLIIHMAVHQVVTYQVARAHVYGAAMVSRSRCCIEGVRSGPAKS